MKNFEENPAFVVNQVNKTEKY